ncbi:LOW QUALITY PROTEIN: protein ABSCISIC ACID-INSENSITIVE 5 [Arachis duranensis]|uniref:LOW QUALITY PROTEIN: protein ABSCISIC ACID-INSENSITIVE 5 n=1 Tax=Arachis duranensis TaxID=130453 RepID=A0A9C6TX36_ARADU|nr:LOW QUALITY PROTEIN: protein ABSCISIC ACID-INSENSITIVE 5 [Arachis duranensis]
MVVAEAEMNNNSQGEVQSPVIQVGEQQAGKNNHHPFSSLGRQSSIYSLTLDEFQHTLCESGKNFGSMNMDEFLSSIWNAEENQAIVNSSNNITNNNTPLGEASSAMMREQQQSLHRQGSLTIPAPLSRKTVEEVWSEIHNKVEQTQQQQQHHHQQSKSSNSNGAMHTEITYRQPTFGEMTLEDFLVKAGVVREQCAMPGIPQPLAASHHHHHPHHQQQQYGVYSGNNSAAMAPSSFVGRTIIGGGAVVAAASPYQAEPSGYPGSSGKRDGGGGAYPTPGSAGGVCFEKVVERRQRRMIKNRESAARSRARKQAYTVELEAELNQLREENAQLKQALAEFEKRRKQQCCEEEMNVRVQTKAQKATEKLRALRRNQSCPL